MDYKELYELEKQKSEKIISQLKLWLELATVSKPVTKYEIKRVIDEYEGATCEEQKEKITTT